MRAQREMRWRRSGGFTMVELLVVIAIIAVLGGIVYAVSVPMIAKSRQTACLNHLRSIGVALQGYVQDNNQRLPEMEAGRSSKNEDVLVMDTVLAPFLENPEAFRCPQDKEFFDKSGCSYLWNNTQSGRLITELSFFGIEDRPDKIPLISDKEAWHPDGTNFLYADLSSSSRVRFTAGP